MAKWYDYIFGTTGTAYDDYAMLWNPVAAATNLISGRASLFSNPGSSALGHQLTGYDMAKNTDITGLQGLTPSEVQMNAYNSNEAQLARDFSAQQAQLNREFQAQQAIEQRAWEEKLANSAYQRAFDDMKKAGLNPYLAYSQGGAVTPASGLPSGSVATASQAKNTLAGRGTVGELLYNLSGTALNLSKVLK